MADDRRPLLERLPRLAERVGWLRLADGLPTPLEPLDDGLWVKRDDLTSSVYGGNKVRKLEVLVAQAAGRGGPIVTTGATGSHFAVATATHARAAGVEVEVVRFPQPLTDHVREVDAHFATLGAAEVRVGRAEASPLVQWRRRWERRREGALFVPAGGSSPYGTLGYVNAALELIEDHKRAGLTEPDEVVVAMSSCGSAVGLALGLSLGGWSRVSVVGVRVADRALTNPVWIGQLRWRTERLLRSAGAPALHPRLTTEHGFLGGGYGVPTDAGESATALAAERYGLTLEPTYTAKAFAAVLARRRPGRRIVYVHTFAG